MFSYCLLYNIALYCANLKMMPPPPHPPGYFSSHWKIQSEYLLAVLSLKRIYIYLKNPDYFGSPAFFMSGDILGKHYMATSEVEVSSISIDDVNVTGICKEYINALSMEHLGFLCLVKNLTTWRPYLSGEIIERMWRQLNNNLQCHFNSWMWLTFLGLNYLKPLLNRGNTTHVDAI